MRKVSMRAILKSCGVVVLLPAVIRAPASTLRAVMMPSKGAVTLRNDCNASNCRTLASWALTFACAALKVAWLTAKADRC